MSKLGKISDSGCCTVDSRSRIEFYGFEASRAIQRSCGCFTEGVSKTGSTLSQGQEALLAVR